MSILDPPNGYGIRWYPGCFAPSRYQAHCDGWSGDLRDSYANALRDAFGHYHMVRWSR
jgi:hypothetical protein